MSEQKKTYVKPAIEGVYLLPDEAVLAECKTANMAGPGGGTCGAQTGCLQQAS